MESIFRNTKKICGKLDIKSDRQFFFSKKFHPLPSSFKLLKGQKVPTLKIMLKVPPSKYPSYTAV